MMDKGISTLNLKQYDMAASNLLSDEINKKQQQRKPLQCSADGNILQGAAFSSTTKMSDDTRISMQISTFTKWINEHLKNENETIIDLKEDLTNGVKLIKLINCLQQPNSKVSKRYFKTPINHHQKLENMTLALNAITQDGIKLVNIANVDIASGNMKLILALIWHLILRYQLNTKTPPKKLVLSFLKTVLPQCKISNLTTDLNDGTILA
jgi:filamin